MWITPAEASRTFRDSAAEAAGVATMEADLAYYRRRSAEERSAADRALNAKVRAIHLELASAYEQRTAHLEAHNGNARLRLVSAA